MSWAKRGMPTSMASVIATMVAAAVVAVVLVVAVARRDARPPLATSAPAGRAPLVDPGDIVSGGPPPDGIPPVDRPRFQAVAEVDWLAAAEPVAVVELAGEAKAYPLQILVWHETTCCTKSAWTALAWWRWAGDARAASDDRVWHADGESGDRSDC